MIEDLKGAISMDKRSNRRRWRNFLAYPSFQFRLAMIQILFVVMVAMALFLPLLIPFSSGSESPNTALMQYASAELVLQVLDRVGLAIVLISIASVLYHILFSHRLCGPLINMGHTFDRVAAGDITRKVFLRRKDFLKEEAARINTMLAALNTRIIDLKTNQEELAAAARQLPDGLYENHLRTLMEENQRLLDQWTVAPDSLPDDPR
jgi:methyl-accepting chemotaxis protein